MVITGKRREKLDLFAVKDRRPRHAIIFSVASVLVAAAIRFGFDFALGQFVPFITFYGAVAAAAWWGGRMAGWAAIILSVIVADYAFLEPRGAFFFNNVLLTTVASHIGFLAVSAMIVFLADRVRTTHLELQSAHAENLRNLESITDGILYVDKEWRYTYLNRAAELYFDKTRAELMGRVAWDVFPEVRGSEIQKQYERAVAEARPVSFETRSPITGRWVEIHAHPIESGLAVYFHDITERKAAEAKLKVSETRFRTLAEAMPDAVWIADKDGKVIYANQRWYAYTGQTSEEIAGDGWSKVIHDEDLERTRKAWQVAVDGGEPYRIEHRLRREIDGAYRWHVCRAEPVRNMEGQVVQWYGTATDIHDRKLAEEALRIRAQVLENMMEGVSLADENGTMLYTNPALDGMFGYERGELLGKHVKILNNYAPAENERKVSAVISELRTKRFWEGEWENRRKAGAQFYTWSRISALDLQDRQYWVCVQADVTHQRRIQQELANANEALEAIVAERTARLQETIGELEAVSYSLSHDLRAPLRAISSFSEILREEYRERLDLEGIDVLNRIAAAAKKLDLLIQDVLLYSRVAKEKIDLHPIELTGFVEDTLVTYPVLKAAGAKVEIIRPLHRVMGHEAFLAQAFMNLTGNAVKFCPAGQIPQIRIRSEVWQGKVRVWVEDNGIGVDPSHHRRIFEMFGRVHSDKEYEGTGIGLAIVKRAVERMGGEIGLNSKMGEGARFWFTLEHAQ